MRSWLAAALALAALLFAPKIAEATTCGSPPFTFVNGTIADATQVNSNTTTIYNCANTLLAPLASPTFTGVPAAPTASAGTNTTQLATTAFVTSAAFAPLASPAFTGVPTAPTAACCATTTQLATVAYVTNNFATQSSATITGATITGAIISTSTLASPTVTGTYNGFNTIPRSALQTPSVVFAVTGPCPLGNTCTPSAADLSNGTTGTGSVVLNIAPAMVNPTITSVATGGGNGAVCFNGNNTSFVFSLSSGACTVSDERLKELGPTMDTAWARKIVMGVHPRLFNWRDEQQKAAEGIQFGVTAQEVQKVFPEIVRPVADMRVNGADVKAPLSVDYARLDLVTLVAVQDLERRVERLERR